MPVVVRTKRVRGFSLISMWIVLMINIGRMIGQQSRQLQGRVLGRWQPKGQYQ